MGRGRRPGPRRNRGKLETILNQLIPGHRRSFEYATWGVVLLVLAHLCWLQLRPKSECRQLYAVATKSPAFQAIILPYERLDRIADQTRDGNLLLKLAGYAKTNPVVAYTLGEFYYRLSYTLYPRRVYVAPADNVINNGGDIQQTEFNPSRQWLQEHDVHFALIFGSGHAEGEMHLDILPLDDGRAGIQTNRTGGN